MLHVSSHGASYHLHLSSPPTLHLRQQAVSQNKHTRPAQHDAIPYPPLLDVCAYLARVSSWLKPDGSRFLVLVDRWMRVQGLENLESHRWGNDDGDSSIGDIGNGGLGWVSICIPSEGDGARLRVIDD
jgi:hypothetical protein